MKKLLLINLLLFTSVLSFSQSEKEQKNSRIGNTTSNSNPKFFNTEVSQKRTISLDSRRPRTIVVQPHPTWDRWGSWGAPFYYDRFDRFYFYDNFNVRRHGRIYVQNDGRRDTVRGKKTNFRLGLHYNTKNQLGGWLTIGGRNYFIIDYSKTINNDQSQFFENITLSDATSWGDQKLNNIEEGWSLYLGLGKQMKNTGVHFMFGFGEEQENYQFFDEFYILSNNGRYSFVNFVQDYFSIKLGIIQDIKSVSIKGEVDPLRKFFTVGAGFNF